MELPLTQPYHTNTNNSGKFFSNFLLIFFPLNDLYETHLTFPPSSLCRHIYLAAFLAIAVTIADRWIIRFSLFYGIFRIFHGKFIIFGSVCWQKWSFQACGSVGKIAFHFHTTMTPFFQKSIFHFFTHSSISLTTFLAKVRRDAAESMCCDSKEATESLPIYPKNYLTTTSRPYWLLHKFFFHLVHPKNFPRSKITDYRMNLQVKTR